MILGPSSRCFARRSRRARAARSRPCTPPSPLRRRPPAPARSPSRPSSPKEYNAWRHEAAELTAATAVRGGIARCADSVREPGTNPVHSGAVTTVRTARPLSLEWTGLHWSPGTQPTHNPWVPGSTPGAATSDLKSLSRRDLSPPTLIVPVRVPDAARRRRERGGGGRGPVRARAARAGSGLIPTSEVDARSDGSLGRGRGEHAGSRASATDRERAPKRRGGTALAPSAPRGALPWCLE